MPPLKQVPRMIPKVIRKLPKPPSKARNDWIDNPITPLTSNSQRVTKRPQCPKCEKGFVMALREEAQKWRCINCSMRFN